MINRETNLPEFISPKAEEVKFDSGYETAQGAYTYVRAFDKVRLKEVDSDKFVVKRYKKKNFSDICPGINNFRNTENLYKVAKELKKRQEEVKIFFEGLPVEVLGSQFVIGKKNNISTVFEIQERISGIHINLGSEKEKSKKYFLELDREHLNLLFSKLKKLLTHFELQKTTIDNLEEDESFFLPDCNLGNFIFDQHGNIYLIDTNEVYTKKGGPMEYEIDKVIENLNEIIYMIEEKILTVD